MNVLVAFVTHSDPESERGIGQTVTAAKALAPRHVHLIYTDETESKFTSTAERLREELGSSLKDIRGEHVELPDARDYERTTEVLMDVLRRVRSERRGLFHLVSGHPQMRLVMALCLYGRVLDGVLHDVSDPDPDKPPHERLKSIDVELFERFWAMSRSVNAAVRLRIQLASADVQLDGKRFYLRASEELARPRAFDILVMLAAKARYGADPALSKAHLKRFVYDRKLQADRDIPRRIKSLNAQAERCSKRSAAPISELILTLDPGYYRLTDALTLPEEVRFEGNVRAFLKDELGCPPTREEFPYLV